MNYDDNKEDDYYIHPFKNNIYEFLSRRAHISPEDDPDEFNVYVNLLDGCDFDEDMIPFISNIDFDVLETLDELIKLDRRRWWDHYYETKERHWIINPVTDYSFVRIFIRGALLDRINFLTSTTSEWDRVSLIKDAYNLLLFREDHIYYSDPPRPEWKRLIPSMHRKFQGLHKYIFSRLSPEERQPVYWYFCVIHLLYQSFDDLHLITSDECPSECFLSYLQEDSMMCQYIIRRYTQSFYYQEYVKEAFDGHWSSSTRNHWLNPRWNRDSIKYHNKERHLTRVHPETVPTLNNPNLLELDGRLEIASLLID